ncbi:MAG: hypothetical protein WA461_04645 [Nitrososphaeraceae archaeon]
MLRIFNISRIGSKVAVVTEASVRYPCLSLIYELKSFTFISLCTMFVGVAAIAGQFDSTNSVLAQGDNGSYTFFNPNNISGIDYGIISSMSQTNESGDLDESDVSSSSENQTNAP